MPNLKDLINSPNKKILHVLLIAPKSSNFTKKVDCPMLMHCSCITKSLLNYAAITCEKKNQRP